MGPSDLLSQVFQDRDGDNNIYRLGWGGGSHRAADQPATRHDKTRQPAEETGKHGAGPYHRAFLDVNAAARVVRFFMPLDPTREFY